jgi:hypothetical protein
MSNMQTGSATGDETTRLDVDAIEARAQRQAPDVPLPVCDHEKRGHAPCCYDCHIAQLAAIEPTFEACGRGDALALVAEVRRLRGIIAGRTVPPRRPESGWCPNHLLHRRSPVS